MAAQHAAAGRARLPVRWRAVLATVPERARQHRHELSSAAITVAGCLLALGGGALIGRWCLGLVMICEAGALIAWGLLRDDGSGPDRAGARTVEQVLDDERWYP